MPTSSAWAFVCFAYVAVVLQWCLPFLASAFNIGLHIIRRGADTKLLILLLSCSGRIVAEDIQVVSRDRSASSRCR